MQSFDNNLFEIYYMLQKFLLSEFEESCIGQIVVRRSGKTQLVLNDVVFDVVLGTKSSFLQVQHFLTFLLILCELLSEHGIL